MPYVLKHRQTGEIYSCTLINTYQLAYYGAKFWESRSEAEEEMKQFLASQAVSAGDAHVGHIDDWEIIEVEESRLKLINVKLKNDATRAIYLDQAGDLTVQTREE